MPYCAWPGFVAWELGERAWRVPRRWYKEVIAGQTNVYRRPRKSFACRQTIRPGLIALIKCPLDYSCAQSRAATARVHTADGCRRQELSRVTIPFKVGSSSSYPCPRMSQQPRQGRRQPQAVRPLHLSPTSSHPDTPTQAAQLLRCHCCVNLTSWLKGKASFAPPPAWLAEQTTLTSVPLAATPSSSALSSSRPCAWRRGSSLQRARTKCSSSPFTPCDTPVADCRMQPLALVPDPRHRELLPHVGHHLPRPATSLDPTRTKHPARSLPRINVETSRERGCGRDVGGGHQLRQEQRVYDYTTICDIGVWEWRR